MKFSRRLSGFLRQRILIVLIILLQIAFVVVTTVFNSNKWEILSGILGAISFFVALYVVNSRDKAAYKISLVFLILLFPIFGSFRDQICLLIRAICACLFLHNQRNAPSYF